MNELFCFLGEILRMGLYNFLKDIYEGKKFQKLALAYDLFMALVIIMAITITIASFKYGVELFNNQYIYYLDSFAVLLFNIDYWGGMILCEDKKAYFKRNFFDLFSLIPVNQAFILFKGFKLLRVLKFLQLFRVVGSLLSIKDEVKRFLKLNGFSYVLSFTFATIILGSIAIYFVEKGKTVETFYDALWWTIVTTTTVGYGDISPQTGGGRIIAVILMFIGIGFIGTLTGSITSFFTEKLRENREAQKKEESSLISLDKTLSDLNGDEIDLSELTNEEYIQVLNFIKFLKEQHK